jgi:hypothetical protein
VADEDDRYFVVDGRRWRRTDPAIPEGEPVDPTRAKGPVRLVLTATTEEAANKLDPNPS